MTKFEDLPKDLAASFRSDVWWAEFWSSITALCWATLSYLSTQDLAVWPSMQVLVQIGNDRFWHIVAFSLGLSQLTSLVLNLIWMRWIAAILMGWFWGVLTLGVWAATPWMPGVAVYAAWCGINLYSILRQLRRSL